MAKLLYTYVQPTAPKHLEQACSILEQGGLLVYPTDVNWAIGCDPSKKKAIERILQLKPTHPKKQPFSFLCNSIAMIADYAWIENNTYRILKKILPGPYTILLKSKKQLQHWIEDKRKILGIRFPDTPLLTDLIHAYGGPILSSSLPQRILDSKGDIKELHFGFEIEAY